jgi:hypothetical protein
MTDTLPGQTRWKFPRQCFICDRSIEKERVTLTFPAQRKSRAMDDSVFVFCVFCGRLLVAEAKLRRGLENSEWLKGRKRPNENF